MAQFQSFEDATTPAQGPRIARLREELQRRGFDGFIVPRADEHQSEYVPQHAERLAWLTGFTGSAGTAMVLADKLGARRRRPLHGRRRLRRRTRPW